MQILKAVVNRLHATMFVAWLEPAHVNHMWHSHSHLALVGPVHGRPISAALCNSLCVWVPITFFSFDLLVQQVYDAPVVPCMCTYGDDKKKTAKSHSLCPNSNGRTFTHDDELRRYTRKQTVATVLLLVTQCRIHIVRFICGASFAQASNAKILLIMVTSDDSHNRMIVASQYRACLNSLTAQYPIMICVFYSSGCYVFVAV